MSEEEVRRWVRADFGIALTTLGGVDHGADDAAMLWRGEAGDGARYAVKLTGGGTAAGLAVPAYLSERGVPGIPAPLRSGSGDLFTTRSGRRLSVVPWVADRTALDTGLDPGQWRAYGEMLARVHAAPVSPAVHAILPHETYTPDRAADVVRGVAARLHGSADPLVDRLARVWKAGGPLVEALLDRADALGRELRRRPAPEVICHSDPHLNNVLNGQDGRVWLIDWDDAMLSAPERDLMFAIGGLSGFAEVSPRQQEWFFEGYGPVEVDDDRLAYFRCLRALEDLDYATVVLDLTRSTSDRQRALRNAQVNLGEGGFVRLALSR